MKKYLLMGILALVGCGVAYAEEGTSSPYVNGVYTVDGKFNVSATVVDKINVETRDVKFGRVAPGTTVPEPEQSGFIKITTGNGSSGSASAVPIRVQLFVGDKGTATITDGKVYLTHEGSISDPKLEYTPEFSLIDGAYSRSLEYNDSELKLTGSPYYTVSIKGTLGVPEDAKRDTYNREMSIRVTYDGEI